ncbi:MAG: hypothetical protein OXI59_06005 [Gemmatimonadota bacterium]|nr:hypothetical protein [Gemmatimonadota bacterium]
MQNQHNFHTDRCLIQRRSTSHGYKYLVFVKNGNHRIATGLPNLEAALDRAKTYERLTA